MSGKTPDEIKQAMREYYPDLNNKSLGNNEGQVIKFACEFQIGDYVVSYKLPTEDHEKIISLKRGI